MQEFIQQEQAIFEKEWDEAHSWGGNELGSYEEAGIIGDEYTVFEPNKDGIKSFLLASHNRLLARVVEEGERLKADARKAKPASEIEEVDERAYCAGIDDIIKELKQDNS